MDEPWVLILVASIGAIGGFLAALVPVVAKRIERKAARKRTQKTISMEVGNFNELRETVDVLFESTRVDRFLILVGFNGRDYVKYASATYEQHVRRTDTAASIGAVSRYRRIEVDDHYRSILKQSETDGLVQMTTANMPDSLLKGYYEMEGVKHSALFHVHRVVDFWGPERDLILYCSMATHGAEPFDQTELTHMSLLVQHLKEFFKNTAG